MSRVAGPRLADAGANEDSVSAGGGEPVRSPSSSADVILRERMEIAFDDLERRVTQSLLRDLHEFRANLSE